VNLTEIIVLTEMLLLLFLGVVWVVWVLRPSLRLLRRRKRLPFSPELNAHLDRIRRLQRTSPGSGRPQKGV